MMSTAWRGSLQTSYIFNDINTETCHERILEGKVFVLAATADYSQTPTHTNTTLIYMFHFTSFYSPVMC